MLPYDKDTWDRLRPAVDSALELDPEARDAYLTALRTTDPELAALVDKFLAQDRAMNAQGVDAPDTRRTAFGSPAATLSGMVLGHYVLDRLLGHGGMGQVWLGHRADGRFEGDVAIKLLNISLMGGAADSRFRREGNILAKLSHPNIARLLDAGISDVSQPFLVLEYVEGSRIDRYCDESRLSPDDRIRLMIDLLAAVAHAHANLTIHRDLKPANILVSSTGQLKLLDFGIAKLLEADDGEAPTATGGRAMTPEFAAPEQILGETITTSTDVYSAGALLYGLLAGVHPTAEGATSSAEFLRATVHGTTMRLSDAVRSTASRSRDDAERIAGLRNSTVERLARAYRGDLDNILARALKRDPAERYPSVALLADDLRRYLAHDAVSVRADSLWYRASRFARRNRIGVAAGAIAATALVAATIVSRRQMHVAETARDRASNSADYARAIGDVQLQLLTLVESGSGKLTADQRLARVQKMVATRYRDQPKIHAAILTMLADRYGQLDDLNKQSELQLQGAGLAQSVNDGVGEAQKRCIAAWVMFRSNRADSADAQLTRATTLLRARHSDDTRAAEIACNTAIAARHVLHQEFDSAVSRNRASAALLERAGDTLTSDYEVVLNGLGMTLNLSGNAREATRIVTRLRSLMLQKGDGETDAFIVITGNVAVSLMALGEFASAQSLLESEIARVHPDGSTSEIPLFFRIRSLSAYRRLGMADSVLRLSSTLAADTSLRLSPPVTLDTHAALAEALLLTGNVGAARSAASALRPLLARVPPQPRWRSQVVLLDAAILNATGGAAIALDSVQRFLVSAGFKASTKAETWLAPVLVRASEYALRSGDARRARALARDAVTSAMFDSIAPLQSAFVGDALMADAHASMSLGDSAAVMSAATRALPALRYGYGALHPRVTSAARLLETVRAGRVAIR